MQGRVGGGGGLGVGRVRLGLGSHRDQAGRGYGANFRNWCVVFVVSKGVQGLRFRGGRG